MLTNAALILVLVKTAVTSAAATSSATYVAPAFLPSTSEWNYEPFDAIVYHVSCARGVEQSIACLRKARLEGVLHVPVPRTRGWPCWRQPAVGQCIHTGGGTMSIGLDFGVFCSIYPNGKRSADDGRPNI
jgi:hypothetical protein